MRVLVEQLGSVVGLDFSSWRNLVIVCTNTSPLSGWFAEAGSLELLLPLVLYKRSIHDQKRRRSIQDQTSDENKGRNQSKKIMFKHGISFLSVWWAHIVLNILLKM